MRLIGVLAVALALAFAPEAAAQQYNFHHYRNADGLPQAQCLAIFQDSSGYMWFGTYGGAARYNGDRFDVFAAADGLVGNMVNAFAEDQGGNVIIGTDQGLSMVSGETVVPVDLPGLVAGEITSLLVDAKNDLWVGTARGLAKVRAGAVEWYRQEAGLPGPRVHDLAVDSHGRFWVATSGGLALVLGERLVAADVALPADVFATTIGELDGTVWFGTDRGLYSLEDGRAMPLLLDRSDGGPIDNVQSVAVSPAGDLWFGTRGHGALVIGGDRREILSTHNGLTSNNVHDTFVDREGNVWLGTDDGVSKLAATQFVYYDQRDGLPHPFVRDIAGDRSGRLWLATRDGVAVRDAEGEIRSLPLPGRISATRSDAVDVLPEGDVLFGTSIGLAHWTESGARMYTERDGLPSAWVMSLSADDQGAWIGTRRGLARWQEGRIDPGPAYLDDEYIALDIEAGPDGSVWVATRDHGLLVLRDGVVRRVEDLPAALDDTILWSLEFDHDDALWIGTNGAGAYRYGPEPLTLDTAAGLRNDFVWQVMVASDGALWLYTNRGLDRWQDGRVVHFDTRDGLPDLEGSVDAAYEDDLGNLWFGTGRGLVQYRPTARPIALPAPLVHVEEVLADGSPLVDGSVPSDRRELTIGYAGLSFHDERALLFRYRLLGLHEDWSTLTPRRQVSFGDLRPGTYTFEVRAHLPDSRDSEPATTTFTVEPGLTQTAWFRALVGAAGLGAVFGLFWLRTRQVERDRRRLRAKVEERTHQLSESERRLRTALSESPTAVFQQDRDLRYTWIENDCFGLALPEALGQRDEEVFEVSAEAEPLRDVKRRVLEKGRPERCDVTAHVGSQRRHYDVSIKPLFDDSGDLTGISGAVTDVTWRARLEAQLNEARRLEAVGQLAGGIAHDFNNLLTGITGFAEFAKSRLDESPAREDIDQVIQCSHRAAKLVSQLLAFSRRQPLERTVLSPNELIEQLSRMLSRIIGEQIHLDFVAGGDVGPIYADSGQVEQVLLNLAVNARDAMPEGGKLTIETRRCQVDAGNPHGVEPGVYVEIAVSDTGTGVDQKTLERIFEPFFTTKDVGQGTGLGLATAYGIVKQHEGAISVYSAPDIGTTFKVLLPVATGEIVAVVPDDSASTSAGSETILLVEDEPAVRAVAERTLREHGYRLYVAADPAEAETLFEAHGEEIDLLLTDVVMPERSGPQLFQSLHPRKPHLRVLYMSGYAQAAAHRAGVVPEEVDLLQKPFQPDEIATKVREVLNAA